MAFIGNTPQNQSFAPAVDYFSGNGVTVTFTLSRPVVSVAQLTVAVDNVIQNPSSAFTVSGNSITFTSAPLSGTNNIWVEYTSLITTYAAISQDPSVIGDITATGGFLAEGDFGNSYIDGTIVDYVTGRARITTGPIDDMTFYHGGTASRSAMMDLYYAGGAKIYGTTALTIPVGTTGERPGTPAVGMTRYNTTNNEYEVYQNGAWLALTTQAPGGLYSVNYLIVAGGGGGGRYSAGGAGGAVVGASGFLTPGSSYAITVGAGGATGPNDGSSSGAKGSPSSATNISSTTALGGGGGVQHAVGYVPSTQDGGSGSGGDSNPAVQGGVGTAGQGNNGGSGANNGSIYVGGGGGGAGAAGTNGSTGVGTGGVGGAGLNWQSLGTYYAGGGGGSYYNPSGGGSSASGGSGGGGNGATNLSTSGAAGSTSGTTNTGGGGGGGGGGNGGSGIVIIQYYGSQRGSGGTVTSSGGYTYHTFTSSGTYIA